ncbi:MAG: hypothetical protein R2761_06715 [Acidimicrobiales bacterium]
MAFLMIREEVWNALPPPDQERVRTAEPIRLGDMPVWIDQRDDSRWFIASDPRTEFAANVQMLEQLTSGHEKSPPALALDQAPDWARAATEDDLRRDPNGLDVGISLLQPIGVREHKAIEEVLSHLWSLIDSGELSPVQSAQVQAMAQVLREASVDLTPGTTERWKVVGVVRGVLRPVFRIAKGTAATLKLIEVVRGIGWSELAHELGDLLS